MGTAGETTREAVAVMDYPPYPPNHCIGVTFFNVTTPMQFLQDNKENAFHFSLRFGFKLQIATVCTGDRGGYDDYEVWVLNPISSDCELWSKDLPAVFFPFTPFNLREYMFPRSVTPLYLEIILDQGNRRAEMRESAKLWFLVNEVDDMGMFDK